MKERLEKGNNVEQVDIFSSKRLIPAYTPIKEEENLSSIVTPDALHQKAIERSKRQKDHGYSKYRDMFWNSYYKKDENRFETGLRLSILKYEEDFINYSLYNNEYVYVKETNALFYTTQDKAEKIKLEDLARFKNELKTIMNTEDDKYFSKHLSYEEINSLITSNGGHTPHSIPLNVISCGLGQQ